MGFFSGLMRGLSGEQPKPQKSGATYDDDSDIMDILNDDDDDMLSREYRKTAIRNSDSNNGWYKCCKCGKSFRLKDMEADHIVPKSKGGDNSRYNLQLICRHCNRSKKNKTDETEDDLARRYGELKEQDKDDLEYLKNLRKQKNDNENDDSEGSRHKSDEHKKYSHHHKSEGSHHGSDEHKKHSHHHKRGNKK